MVREMEEYIKNEKEREKQRKRNRRHMEESICITLSKSKNYRCGEYISGCQKDKTSVGREERCQHKQIAERVPL